MARKASRLVAILSSKFCSRKTTISPSTTTPLSSYLFNQNRHFAAAPPAHLAVSAGNNTGVICGGIIGGNVSLRNEQIDSGTMCRGQVCQCHVRRQGLAGTNSFCSARTSTNASNLPSLWGSNSRRLIHTTAARNVENRRPVGPMSFVKGIMDEEGRDSFGVPPYSRHTEDKLDVVNIKLIKNNTFITITDSNGNKKAGASSGCLKEMGKGGPKISRYAAEATAEHVGRLARSLGMKSVLMRVNGFCHFKKKKQAILSWREGFTYGRGDHNPIKFIEDTTRRPHNGCRLPKRRRT